MVVHHSFHTTASAPESKSLSLGRLEDYPTGLQNRWAWRTTRSLDSISSGSRQRLISMRGVAYGTPLVVHGSVADDHLNAFSPEGQVERILFRDAGELEVDLLEPELPAS